MTRVLAPYEAPDNVLPGAIGGSASGLARFSYRGTKWLAGRILRWGFKPKSRTYRGAVGRGLALSVIYPWLQDDEDDDLGAPEIPTQFQTGRSFQQRGNRQRQFRGRGRHQYHRRTGCCC